MANITLRKGTEERPLLAERDPFRIMKEVLGWEPFREMLHDWPWRMESAVYVPAFEVKETKDAYLFRADLPGVKESDLEIDLTGKRLTVRGKRDAEREESGETFFVYERTYGSFTRTFTLPDGIDVEHIKTELKDGVLTMVVPKLPEVLPRKIPIGGQKVKT